MLVVAIADGWCDDVGVEHTIIKAWCEDDLGNPSERIRTESNTHFMRISMQC